MNSRNKKILEAGGVLAALAAIWYLLTRQTTSAPPSSTGTLTVSAATGGIVSPSGTIAYTPGTTVLITATPTSGYYWGWWNFDNQAPTYSGQPDSIIFNFNVQDNGPHTLVANFLSAG